MGTLGRAERQGRLGSVAVARRERELPERSVYRLLHAERDRLFPDELFADLYVHHGRRSVPPSILAVVMVLQRRPRGVGLTYEGGRGWAGDAAGTTA
jgi:hypothetical protein